MKNDLKIIVLSVCCILCFQACNRRGIRNERVITNLEAFAKVYGYARWFHPSPESEFLNWDQFAINGVGKIINCQNDNELKNRLQDLFFPVAPTCL